MQKVTLTAKLNNHTPYNQWSHSYFELKSRKSYHSMKGETSGPKETRECHRSSGKNHKANECRFMKDTLHAEKWEEIQLQQQQL